MSITRLLTTLALTSTITGYYITASAAERATGRGTGPVIYVTSQGLYYDSIVLADLPQKGRFQQLAPGMHGIETDYGPGDVGHLGGRWWLDLNSDGIMNEGDRFFLCPLLGPGRETP
jgi:hypothetical protein